MLYGSSYTKKLTSKEFSVKLFFNLETQNLLQKNPKEITSDREYK